MVAWTAMLLTSSLAVIIWREFALGEPGWWPSVHAVGLVVIFALTFARADLRPLRGFVLVLLVLFLLGFGGGWNWGLIPLVRLSQPWLDWTSRVPWAISSMAVHLLRLTPALAILIVLLLLGRRRGDLFLVKGDIGAPVEPSRLLGMKKPEPWTRIGSIFAAIFCVGMLCFLLFSVRPTFEELLKALPLIPIAVVIAAVNAFNEEFILRAAPLSELSPVVGKRQALMVTTFLFGVGHFYGVPNGLIGVLLAGFLGWFLGKSLLETGGFFWAWLIHFLQDVIIFTFYAMYA